MNQNLSNHQWLALEQINIADIVAYSYIAHAPAGDVSLQDYPHIRNWLQRVEALENFFIWIKQWRD